MNIANGCIVLLPSIHRIAHDLKVPPFWQPHTPNHHNGSAFVLKSRCQQEAVYEYVWVTKCNVPARDDFNANDSNQDQNQLTKCKMPISVAIGFNPLVIFLLFVCRIFTTTCTVLCRTSGKMQRILDAKPTAPKTLMVFSLRA